MAGEFVVSISGLDGLAAWNDLPGKVGLNAQRAVNAAADRARKTGKEEIQAQINFPDKYLSNNEGRFTISKYARQGDLEAIVKARSRVTSLARFALQGEPAAGARPTGVSVEVKSGLAQFMTGAFLIKLRRGNSNVDTKFNLGLAIRLRNAGKLRNSARAKLLAPGLYLLYGPSVAQVFGGDRGVAGKIADPIVAFMRDEYDRLMDANI